MKLKCYLSGGMHSGWQKKIIPLFPSVEFLNPCEHRLTDPAEYTRWDMNAIIRSNIVFAYFEKTNPSGLGLAFEIGLAVGYLKPVVLVDEICSKYTAILRHSVTVYCETFIDGQIALKKELQELQKRHETQGLMYKVYHEREE